MEETKSWSNARLRCKELDGDLASIGSKVEFDIVRKTLAPYSTNWYLWTGFSDNATEGTFVWSDGTKNVGIEFDSGQPNGGKSQNCAYIWTYTLKLHDRNCNDEMFFLCKLN